ncbi:MAG: sigma factor-like helix-turn-helix DNA-binding protein [Actinomycetaceae bacterium]|nr:sigma factor-like helix-turn-helix DNA-binding protein [Actinomycetaceae bacterium]
MKHLDVNATRSGKWWVGFFTLDGHEHGTQAHTLKQLESMVKDAAALLTDRPIDDFTVTIRTTDNEITDLVTQYEKSSAQAASARSQLALASRTAVTRMREKGLTMEDIGQILGLTKGRISQLARA